MLSLIAALVAAAALPLGVIAWSTVPYRGTGSPARPVQRRTTAGNWPVATARHVPRRQRTAY